MQFFFSYTKVRNKPTGAIGNCFANGTFTAINILPFEFLTHDRALKPLIEIKRPNKTYCAKSTKWVNRLPYFDIENFFAGRHFGLTSYLSKNPVFGQDLSGTYEKKM